MPAIDRRRRVLEHLSQMVAPSVLRTVRCAEDTPLDGGGRLWLVGTGLVRLHRLGPRPVLLEIFGPGAVASLGASGAGSEVLTADAGSEVFELETLHLGDIAHAHPEILVGVTLALERQRSDLRERLAIRQRGRVVDQLVAGLDVLAAEVGVPCRHGHPGSVDLLGLSHQDIADLMGSSRSYVTTILSQLQRDGWIRLAAVRQLCLGPAVRRLR